MGDKMLCEHYPEMKSPEMKHLHLQIFYHNKDDRKPFRESEWPSEGIVIRTGRFLVQNPLCARPGLGTQPGYEVPGDLWVELAKMQQST